MLTTIALMWMAMQLQAPLWAWFILWAKMVFCALQFIGGIADAAEKREKRKAKEQAKERIAELERYLNEAKGDKQ
jgi:hypothetical protein